MITNLLATISFIFTTNTFDIVQYNTDSRNNYPFYSYPTNKVQFTSIIEHRQLSFVFEGKTNYVELNVVQNIEIRKQLSLHTYWENVSNSLTIINTNYLVNGVITNKL